MVRESMVQSDMSLPSVHARLRLRTRRRARAGGAMLVLASAVTCVLLLACTASAPADPVRTAGAERFAGEIDAFEARDDEALPAPGAILFTGSSSVRMWNTLARDMAPLRTVNRGFGGSHIAHVDFYAERIVAPYAPRAVVLYAGDNDLAGDAPKTPERVLADFDLFVERVHALAPGAPIFFLAIKPSLSRWRRWPDMERANALIAARAEASPDITYIDVATPMLGADGRPDPSLFIEDGLHLNAKGYAAWTRVARPVLLRESPEP